jgi:phospholipase D1/2
MPVDQTLAASPTSARPSRAPTPRRRPLLILLPLLPLLLLIAAVWGFADLDQLNSADKVAAAARKLSASPAAFPYVLLAFVFGTAVFFPVTALITGTVLAFDPVRGFTYAFFGTLLGACTTYALGRLMGSRALTYLSGPRMNRFGELMRAHAVRASIAARLLPIGNFTGLNLFAGSLRIPFGSYFVGNVIGILPGVLFLTLFAERLGAAFKAPNWQNLTVLGVALVLALCVVLLMRRRKRRMRDLLTPADVHPLSDDDEGTA